MRVAPVDLPDGSETQGWAIAVTDLTERRKLERLHAADVEQRRAIRDAFARYLAPHVVEQLMRAPGGVALGGERATATILFADIVGFTELADRLDAETVVEILNNFFSAAVQIVFEHDGLLDKFYGDGLMVVFGPPRVRDDDAKRALAVAEALHRAAATIQADGKPLQLSIGLATGEVVAGHIGSPKRMDYTVIGDAANLASRLQGAAPPSRTYVDDRTYTRIHDAPPAEKLIAKSAAKPTRSRSSRSPNHPGATAKFRRTTDGPPRRPALRYAHDDARERRHHHDRPGRRRQAIAENARRATSRTDDAPAWPASSRWPRRSC